jgi:hypothetical protein
VRRARDAGEQSPVRARLAKCLLSQGASEQPAAETLWVKSAAWWSVRVASRALESRS